MNHTNRSHTNRCKEYAEWISDEGLGALAPGREGELLAHAAECEDCRAAYQHARELAAVVDRGVESLVAGEPSAHFATRLRARIASEPEPARFGWLTWKPIAAGLITAVVAAVVFFAHVPQRRNPPRAPAGTLHAQAEPKPSAAGAVQPTLNSGPSATRGEDTRRLVATGRGNHDKPGSGLSWGLRPGLRERQVAQRAVASREPEVIVPPGQLEAVMEFAKAVQSGRIDGKQLLAAEEEADQPAEIKPLEIKPIEIAPLDNPQPDAPPKPATTSSNP
jgi:hypothetical protein